MLTKLKKEPKNIVSSPSQPINKKRIIILYFIIIYIYIFLNILY